MRNITTFEDEMNRVVRYAFPDGQCLAVDADAVKDFGIEYVLRQEGLGRYLETDRTEVVQRGKVIGTLPPNFEPMRIKSTSFLYEVRGDDFKQNGDKWVAADSLCPGDFDAIPGFVWKPQ
jgi:hypothetical protein